MKTGQVENKFLTVNGLRIRYMDVGSGRPIILLHPVGVETAAEFWLDSFELFRELGHVYALDLPGWGLSDLPNHLNYSFAHWVDTVEGFCQELSLDGVDLVGRTNGAWVAALFAHRRPDKVRRLVLANAAGLNPVATIPVARHSVWPTREAIGIYYTDTDVIEEIHSRLQEPGRQEAYLKLLSYIGNTEVRQEWSLRSRLPEMTTPMLFVQSDNNIGQIPAQNAWDGFLLAPSARLHIGFGANWVEMQRVAADFLAAGDVPPVKEARRL